MVTIIINKEKETTSLDTPHPEKKKKMPLPRRIISKRKKGIGTGRKQGKEFPGVKRRGARSFEKLKGKKGGTNFPPQGGKQSLFNYWEISGKGETHPQHNEKTKHPSSILAGISRGVNRRSFKETA